MPKPLTERIRRRLIKNFTLLYERLIEKKHEWKAQVKASNAAVEVAGHYFALGETDKAIKWYGRAADVHMRFAGLNPSWKEDSELKSTYEFSIGQNLWRSGRQTEARKHFLAAAETLREGLETTTDAKDSRHTTATLASLTSCYLYLGDFERAYVFAKRRYEIDQKRELMIRKLKNPRLKDPPKLPPSQSVPYNMCKAIVERDKEALARAKKGLEHNIALELAEESGRGVFTDFRIVLERAEKETSQS